MKCEAVQNRLLDLPNLTVVPDAVQLHLADCELCNRFLERAHSLYAEIATLPAPSSELAKVAYLESLTAAGPVIKSRPTTGTGSQSLVGYIQQIPVSVLTSLAAVLLIAVGLWTFWPTKQQPIPLAKATRHQLLERVVKLNTELATINTPVERVTKLSGLVTDLRSETQALSKAAQYDEMLSLAKMYENVVNKGILAQAEQMNQFNTKVQARQDAIRIAIGELSRSAKDMTELEPTASQQVQPLLKRIAKTAQDGEARLLKLANGEA